MIIHKHFSQCNLLKLTQTNQKIVISYGQILLYQGKVSIYINNIKYNNSAN